MNQSHLSIPLLVVGCGLLFFVGHIFEYVFKRYRVPDVLLLILLGLTLGPLFGWIRPPGDSPIEHLFGHIALIIILFHGGMDLHLKDLRTSALSASRIAMGLMAVTAVTVALVARFTFGQPWAASWLLGLVLSPLAATVVLPLLAQLPFSKRMKSVMTLESALGDVLAIVAVLSLSEALVQAQASVGQTLGRFLSAIGAAAIIGAGAGLLGSLVLGWLKRFGKMGFASQAMLLVVAGGTEWLGFSGAIAALAFGVVFRNLDQIAPKILPERIRTPEGLSQSENDLLHEAVFILKVAFFFYLGTLLGVTDPKILGAGIFAALLIMVLRLGWFRVFVKRVGRPSERWLAGVLCGRGLSSAVLATIPLEMGIPGGTWIRDVAFVVILVSNVLTGAGVLWVMHRRASEEAPEEASI